MIWGYPYFGNHHMDPYGKVHGKFMGHQPGRPSVGDSPGRQPHLGPLHPDQVTGVDLVPTFGWSPWRGPWLFLEPQNHGFQYKKVGQWIGWWFGVLHFRNYFKNPHRISPAEMIYNHMRLCQKTQIWDNLGMNLWIKTFAVLAKPQNPMAMSIPTGHEVVGKLNS